MSMATDVRGQPVLRRALEQLRETTAEGLGSLIPPGEVKRALEAVAEAAYAGDALPDFEIPDDVSASLFYRLLEATEDEIIGLWREERAYRDPEEFLEALEVLHSVNAALRPRQSLATQLARPDAYELIVELAHDLRSPLTSILFLSETLRSGHSGSINDRQKSQLGLIYSAALGLSTVAQDVLEVARESLDPRVSDPTPFSVVELLAAVREMVEPMAEVKGIGLRVDRPEVDRRVGHPLALSRVLLNLTTNALKFTSEGFVEISTAKLDRIHVEFSVRDTGRGLTDEARRELFESFRRARRREGYYFSSSGLGLSIVQRLVERMGSELDLETEEGEGTRFFFTLALPPAADF